MMRFSPAEEPLETASSFAQRAVEESEHALSAAQELIIKPPTESAADAAEDTPPELQAPQGSTLGGPVTLRPEPLTLEQLRQFREFPKVSELVEKEKSWLRLQPELSAAGPCSQALSRAEVGMREAFHGGYKGLERKLRIRVLALDELSQERLTSHRPLPVLSAESTHPARSLELSAAPRRFVVGAQDGAANLDRASSPSPERPPIHRRAELGLNEASEQTLVPDVMPTSYDPTPPAPSQREESQPWAPDGLPIHRLDDLRVDTIDKALSPEPPPLPLEEPDTLDETPNASMLDDGPTVSGRNDFDVQAVTQDVSLTDILEEDGPPDPSTQNRFNAHFSNLMEARTFRDALYRDISALDRMGLRSQPASPDAAYELQEIRARAASFQARPENAGPQALFAQYRALVEDEAQPDRTENAHFSTRMALALLYQEATRRQSFLVAGVAGDIMADLKNSPWDIDEARAEAILLMITRDRSANEYPYMEKGFLEKEVILSQENDPDYARVCSLMLSAQKAAGETAFLLFQIEQDAVAYRAAQDRATSMLKLPSERTDDRLMRDLATARLDLCLAHSEAAAEQALRRGREATLIHHVLPRRRAIEVETAPHVVAAGKH